MAATAAAAAAAAATVSIALPSRAPQRLGRDVPFTPLCPPSTCRPEAQSAQCACLAIHGERTQGPSLKPAGRPSLARAGRSLLSRPLPLTALIGRRWATTPIGGGRPEGRCSGYHPKHDNPPDPHFDPMPSWSSAIQGAADPAGVGRPEGRCSGYTQEHDTAPDPHFDPMPSWSSAVPGAAGPTGDGAELELGGPGRYEPGRRQCRAGARRSTSQAGAPRRG